MHAFTILGILDLRQLKHLKHKYFDLGLKNSTLDLNVHKSNPIGEMDLRYQGIFCPMTLLDLGTRER